MSNNLSAVAGIGMLLGYSLDLLPFEATVVALLAAVLMFAGAIHSQIRTETEADE